MKSLILHWILGTVTILATAYVIPGIRVERLSSAIWAAAVLGILNAFVKPILILLTLPITILTLGLFLIVINALILMAVTGLISGFRIESFWHAVLAAIVISIINYILSLIF